MIKNLFTGRGFSVPVTACRCLLLLALFSPTSQATVFTIPQFVEHKSWAIGFEPEATLATQSPSGTGMAFNTKFTWGLSPVTNLQVGIGPGSGEKDFRLGATYSFDWIPDLPGQFGAGLAAQAYYFNLRSSTAKTEFSVYPYLHKNFPTSRGFDVDPFLALPVGMSFTQGQYFWTAQVAVGSYIRLSEHVGWNLETGLNLQNTDSYLALGVTYRD